MPLYNPPTTVATMTVTGLTAGRVATVDTGGLLAVDNLFWDKTNDFLGVGSAASTPLCGVQSSSLGTSRSLGTGILSTAGGIANDAGGTGFTWWGPVSGKTTLFHADGSGAVAAAMEISSTVTRLYGNVCIGLAAAGATAAKVVALSNSATAPTTTVDMAQLYGLDLAGVAGHSGLGLFSEEAVAADIAVASSSSYRVAINGTVYKILLAAG